MQATRSGLFDWPRPEPNSASSGSNGSGSNEEQQTTRKHRQKRISATEELLVNGGGDRYGGQALDTQNTVGRIPYAYQKESLPKG